MGKSVVLISGANGGIGSAIALELMSDFKLSLGSRSLPSLPLLQEAVSGQRMHHTVLEAENENCADDWISGAMSTYGRIDAVINCIGSYEPYSFKDDLTELDRLLDVNLKAPIRIIRAAYPYLIHSPRPKIINLVSLSGLRVASPESSGYAISKFALRALGHAVRQEGWDKNLRVTSICPGWVNTKMVQGRASIEESQMTQPEDIAKVVRLLLSLPPTCSISELAINCMQDPLF